MDYKRNAILGFAIADAVGVPVEFSSSKERKNDPVKEMRGFGSWNQPAGTWSDDTSMTIATMESIARLEKIDCIDIMSNFIKWYDNNEFTVDKLFDIGNTTRKAIIHAKEGIPNVPTIYSNGNGSLMRIMPVAVYLHTLYSNNFDDEAMDIIHNVSALTHGHEISKMACGLYCLIAAELLEGKPIKEAVNTGLSKGLAYYEGYTDFAIHLKHFMRLYDKNFANLPVEDLRSGGYVIESIEASIWCLLNTNDFKSLILKAVNLGHDTDTTAAIAAGLGCLVYDTATLPSEWIETLRAKDKLTNIETAFIKTLDKIAK